MNTNIATAPERDKVEARLGPKQNPTILSDRRVALPHANSGFDVDTPNRKAKKRGKNSAPAPAVPPSAIRMAKVGGTIALIAAAAISAQTLVSLGHTIGLHGKIAWLLPASLDVYAATAIWVGYRIPSVHPAASVARRDARLALSLTVCCNVLYHLLILAGSSLPKPLTDTLLLCVGALPPLVVERIFHLQMSVRNGDDGNEAAPDAAAGRSGGSSGTAQAAPAIVPSKTQPARGTTPNPGTDTPPGTARGTDHGTAAPATPERAKAAPTTTVPPKSGTRTPFEEWVKRAVPLWNAYVEKHQAEPIAAVLGNQVRLAHPEPDMPTSDRWDRKLCAAVREAVTPSASQHEEADDDSEAVAR